METKINQDEIIIGKYKTDTPNPSVASTYSRNSYGTIVVDDNVSGIESKKLVVNLVGTRYNNNSFINVLDTDFEEFLDPEIKIPEKIEETEDLSGTILALQAQLAAEKLKNDSNQAIVEELQKAITNAQQSVISGLAEELTPTVNKKSRIFSDGTLLRDKNDTAFFYIVEDGKKRFFNFNEELLNITAKSIGKIKVVSGQEIPDLIDVSQDVLDDIPSGQPFTNFDLVKDVNTPALPPLKFPGGERIVAKWVNSAPVTLEVTSDQLNNLTIDLDLQMSTDQGIINYLHILDLPRNPNNQPDVSGWFPGRLSLVASKVAASGENSIRRFTIPLKRTALDYNNRIPFSAGTSLQPLLLNATTPEITIPITAKLYNDTDGEGFSDTKYVTIKLKSKVPSLSGKKVSAARTELVAQGLQLNVTGYTYTNVQANDDKIVTQDVPVNTLLAAGSIINVTANQYGRIVPNVIGKKLGDARKAITDEVLIYKSSFNGPSDTKSTLIGAAILAGRTSVNSQIPAAGTIVDPDTEVTVYYTIY